MLTGARLPITCLATIGASASFRSSKSTSRVILCGFVAPRIIHRPCIFLQSVRALASTERAYQLQSIAFPERVAIGPRPITHHEFNKYLPRDVMALGPMGWAASPGDSSVSARPMHAGRKE